MYTGKTLFTAAILLSTLPLSVSAATITNGGFEDPALTDSLGRYDAGSGSLTGWTIDSGNIDQIGTFWEASEGSQSVELNGDVAGTISQEITGLITGADYVLSFDLAGNPNGGPDTKVVDVGLNDAVTRFSFDSSGQSTTDMGWVTKSVAFSAIGPTTTLFFSSDPSVHDSFQGAAIDNVSLSEASAISAVPLPASLPFLAGGLAFLGLWSRRRNG